MEIRLNRELESPCGAHETVARAIHWLLERADEQPSLSELARAVGLSEFHLQRLFASWAGVSPKRFLQFLTKERAKRALRESADVLHASFAAGLSGPGRLHDLLVACDGVTPGEVRRLGAALRIDHGIAPTPFGEAHIALTPRGVCHWRFVDGGRVEEAIEALAAEWPRSTLRRDDGAARGAAAAAFAGGARGRTRTLPLLLQGTNFQIKVWEALLRIPEGALVSYGQVAAAVGAPRAARAVARTVAGNPIGYLIPCHRVIRESGILGEYRWGRERKAALIAWEGARREAEGTGKSFM